MAKSRADIDASWSEGLKALGRVIDPKVSGQSHRWGSRWGWLDVLSAFVWKLMRGRRA